MDPKEFRTALGRFATGVTIVTTRDANGRPVGVTASSFNSVSLNPPLVLWSLAKSAQSLEAFQEFGHFAVHVLSSDQQELSDRFARTGADKFAGLEFNTADNALPLFDNCAARFVCGTSYQYEGGDHFIFVGEVVDFTCSDNAPLLFHDGSYKEARHRVSGEAPVGDVDINRGTFSDDFFSYLLARAHFQISYPVRKERDQAAMREDEYLCLALLSLTPCLGLEDLQQRLEHTGMAPDKDTVARLIEKGWIMINPQSDPPTYSQSDAGRDLFIDLLAKSKALEESILTQFTPLEVAEMRGFLRRLVAVSNPGVPRLWD